MRNVLRVVVVLLAIGGVVDVARTSVRARGMNPATPKRSDGLSIPIAGIRTGEIADAGRLIIPVAGVHASQLKSSFNEGRAGHLHHAIDILAPRGTPVLAAVDGKVQKLFFSRAGGITLYEFDADSTTSFYYAHLDGYAAGIVEGKALHRGEVIGYVGTTGNAPPGTPHLHFAIEKLPPAKEWWKGDPIDPYPILVARGETALGY